MALAAIGRGRGRGLFGGMSYSADRALAMPPRPSRFKFIKSQKLQRDADQPPIGHQHPQWRAHHGSAPVMARGCACSRVSLRVKQ